jgi:hypothetical protein
MIIAHAGGWDEMAMFVMPAVMGIGLYFIFRSGKDEEHNDPGASEES